MSLGTKHHSTHLGGGVVMDVVSAFWRAGKLYRVELVEGGAGLEARVAGRDASMEDALRMSRRLDIPVVIREKGVLVAVGDMYVADRDSRLLLDAEWVEVGGGIYASRSYASFYESLKPRGFGIDAQSVVDSIYWHPAVIYSIAARTGALPRTPAIAASPLLSDALVAGPTLTPYVNAVVVDAHGFVSLASGRPMDYALLYARAVITSSLLASLKLTGRGGGAGARKLAAEVLKELSQVKSFRSLLRHTAARLKSFHGAVNTDLLMSLVRVDEAYGIAGYRVRRLSFQRELFVEYEVRTRREPDRAKVERIIPGARISGDKLEFEAKLRTLLDVVSLEAPGHVPV